MAVVAGREFNLGYHNSHKRDIYHIVVLLAMVTLFGYPRHNKAVRIVRVTKACDLVKAGSAVIIG